MFQKLTQNPLLKKTVQFGVGTLVANQLLTSSSIPPETYNTKAQDIFDLHQKPNIVKCDETNNKNLDLFKTSGIIILNQLMNPITKLDMSEKDYSERKEELDNAVYQIEKNYHELVEVNLGSSGEKVTAQKLKLIQGIKELIQVNTMEKYIDYLNTDNPKEFSTIDRFMSEANKFPPPQSVDLRKLFIDIYEIDKEQFERAGNLNPIAKSLSKVFKNYDSSLSTKNMKELIDRYPIYGTNELPYGHMGSQLVGTESMVINTSESSANSMTINNLNTVLANESGNLAYSNLVINELRQVARHIDRINPSLNVEKQLHEVGEVTSDVISLDIDKSQNEVSRILFNSIEGPGFKSKFYGRSETMAMNAFKDHLKIDLKKSDEEIENIILELENFKKQDKSPDEVTEELPKVLAKNGINIKQLENAMNLRFNKDSKIYLKELGELNDVLPK
ncbi:MAG: hypothetical protein MK033_05040 [Candidatus Caenarcaniphilales bacterium]|nr:hypothetical protein [Candidatus Caenarcaniphilales bacterium]